jgi:hypothetical protein
LIRFDRRQLVAFVRALDRNLEQPTTVVVIGGAAAAMAYHAGTRTADIDVWQGLSEAILQAAERARRETGLAIEIGSAAGGRSSPSTMKTACGRLAACVSTS